MPKQIRLNFIGASGVGKTTLGKAIASQLALPFFDSDFYYHEQTDPPFQMARDPLVRRSLVMKDLGSLESWVLSGTVANWDPKPELDYTCVVFLYLPPTQRIERLKVREQVLYGDRIRPGGDMQQLHTEFMDWTAGYDSGTSEGTNTLQHHERFFESVKCSKIRFDSAMTTQQQIDEIIKLL